MAEDAELAETEGTDIEPLVPTDEPEELTLEQAAIFGTPIAPVEEPHIACTVCGVCLELNLTTKSVIRCARCEQAFCLHFASAVDAQYCVNCMSEISVEKSTISKVYEHTNAETGAKSFYRRKARDIKIAGLDWLFAQRKIYELSDVELDLAIEYHRNILSLMMAEQSDRRVEMMHRYANVKVSIPTPATTDVKDSTTTTVKKTHTVSKTKAQEQLAALLSSMKSKGVNINDLMKMVQK